MDVVIEEWKPKLPIVVSNSEILNCKSTFAIKAEVTTLKEQQQQKSPIEEILEIKTEAVIKSDEPIEEYNELEDPLNINELDYIRIKEQNIDNLEKHIHEGVHFKRHIKTVHFFKCVHCEKSFSQAKLLKTHVRAVHKSLIKDRMCNHCRKFFSTSQFLKRHVKAVHEGVEDQICNHCSKSFSEATNLKTHVKAVHEGLKDHICNICEKSYSQAGYLKAHIKAVHEGVKNHECKHCKKGFFYAGDLKKHFKSIHGWKEWKEEFKCHKCEKSFINSEELSAHDLVFHVYEKKHKCDKCEEAFGCPVDLKRHIMNIHDFFPPEVFSCTKCGEAFYNKKDLKLHELYFMHRIQKYKCCKSYFKKIDGLKSHQMYGSLKSHAQKFMK